MPTLTNITLVGYMGAGKSSVGRRVASRLGYRFVDIDDLVCQRANRSIPEIFASAGQEEFRRLESEVLREVTADSGQVIATGGGIVERDENWEQMRRTSIVLWLAVPVETMWARVAGDENRPMLDAVEPRRRFLDLYEQRRALYARADLKVHGGPGQPCETVANQVMELVQAGTVPVQMVRVDLDERTYGVFAGNGLLATAGAFCRAVGLEGKALVVTNTTLAPLYADTVQASLVRAGFDASVAVMEDGEDFKTQATVSQLYDACVAHRLDRQSFIVSVGGGVVGDTAGFVAATYMRGIPFVQVPTSLLAQVDASVGGKVAVNHREGKNLIGAFHQPQCVLADVEVLQTLPQRQLVAGMAEVVKHGLIRDENFFTFLESNLKAITALDPATMARLVQQNCRIKARVVEADEREAGGRAILNFGHTVGHAIETTAGYGRYAHGEAVALGMVAEAELSRRYGLLGAATVSRISALLAELGLPTRIDPALDVNTVLEAMKLDKKAVGGRIRFVLLEGIGRTRIVDDVPLKWVEEVVRWEDSDDANSGTARS